MEEGAADGDVGEASQEDERCVVVFRGSRHQARVIGSTSGPTVLVPGPEQGWQVLVALPGAVAGHVLADAIRFATSGFGLDEPPALSLHRRGTRRWMVVPVAPGRKMMRTWAQPPLRAGDSDQDFVDELTPHLVAMAPEASPADVIDVLQDQRGDGTPLHDLVAMLGLPTAALDALEADDLEVPDGGELLIRADKITHARTSAKVHAAERWDAKIAAIKESRWGPAAISRAGNRVFGVVYIALGVTAVTLGALCLLLGVQPTNTLTGVDHPAGWVVLGVAMVWFGRHQRRRGEPIS